MSARVRGAEQAEQTTVARGGVVAAAAVGEQHGRPGRGGPPVAPGDQRQQGRHQVGGLAGGQVFEPLRAVLVAVPLDHAVGEQGVQAKIADEIQRWKQTVPTTFCINSDVRHLGKVAGLVRR